jgi:hypothetical protein
VSWGPCADCWQDIEHADGFAKCDACSMPRWLTTYQFRLQCSMVESAVKSLIGCRRSEVPRELATLERCVKELLRALPRRRSDDLRSAYDNALAHARVLIDMHGTTKESRRLSCNRIQLALDESSRTIGVDKATRLASKGSL